MESTLQQKVLKEFEMMVELLRNNDIEVIVIDDTQVPIKPDAIFPNNWFTCNKKTITLFSMFAENRRTERRIDIIEEIKYKTGIHNLFDLSHHEKDNKFLEGTGSMVCDHQNKIIYACLSERTNEQLVKEFAANTGYATCIFSANDRSGREIYHTNVIMCVGEHFAIVCSDSICDERERRMVINELENTGHELIHISQDQMHSFAGNMLQVISKAGIPLLLMSTTAANALDHLQKASLKKYCRPLVADVSTIEKAGGGSVRCMVAEIFS